MISKPALTKDDAILMLGAAEAEAVKNGWKVSLAVCDEGGHLLAFVRLPGANLASTEIAQAKARTATLLKRETKGVEEMINQGRYAFLSAPNIDGLLEGGVPVMVEEHCVGGIGVSGVLAAQDAQIAKAGLAALQAA